MFHTQKDIFAVGKIFSDNHDIEWLVEKAKSMALLIKTDSVYSCNKSQKNEEHFQKEANVSTMVVLTHMETNIG